MEKQELENIIVWVKGRLSFMDKRIEEAQQTKNYGKEVHCIAQREVYFEMLDKLKGARI